MGAPEPRQPDDRLPPARHWPRWERLSSYFFDGPILGNGLLGAVVHRQAADRFDGNPDTVLFAFNRADLTQPVPRIPEGPTSARFMVGRFTLRPAGAINAIEMELDLAAAELRGVVRTSRGEIELRAMVHATRPVLVIEQTARGDERPAEIGFLPAPAGVVRELGRVDYEESATYDPHPPAQRTHRQDVTLHEQRIGGGRSYAVAWTQHATAPQSARFLATLACSHPVEAAGFDPVSVIHDARETAPEVLDREHRHWWSDHYARLTLALPDDPEAERFWWLQQYKIGCLMRPDLQLLDLLGPWYCHTPWPGIWWNLNTEMMYRHLATGNRAELGAPLLRILERNADQLRRNLPAAWRAGGAMAIGRASSFDLDSPVTMEANEGDPTREGREAGNLLWALHTVWWLLGHAADENVMRLRLVPLLRAAVKLYDELLVEGDDGRWHLRETFSPEYKAAADCHYDLALLRWGCDALAGLCPDDDPNVGRWRHLARRLVDYPLDAAGTFAVGRGVVFDRGHRHFAHLLGVWPIGDVDCATPESARRVSRSIEHWLSCGELAGWSHAAAAAMYARLGDGDAAIAQFRLFLRSLTFTSLYREAGLCLETPFLGLDALHAMLVQSGRGHVRLLPALPPGWRSLRLDGMRLFGRATLALALDGDEVRATISADGAYVANVSLPGTLRPVAGAATPQPDGSSTVAIPAAGGRVELAGVLGRGNGPDRSPARG